MSDEMLEEIWRVREELIKKHGGMEGYIKYVQKLERAHARRLKKNGTKRSRRKRVTRKSVAVRLTIPARRVGR